MSFYFARVYLLDSEHCIFIFWTKRSQNIVYSKALVYLTFFFFPLSGRIHLESVVGSPVREEHHQRAWTELLSGTLGRFSVAFKALHRVKGFSTVHTLGPSSCPDVKMTPLTAPRCTARAEHSIDLLAARCETKQFNRTRSCKLPPKAPRSKAYHISFCGEQTNKEKCWIMQRRKLVFEIFRALMKTL